jgi:hypothetical protein
MPNYNFRTTPGICVSWDICCCVSLVLMLDKEREFYCNYKNSLAHYRAYQNAQGGLVNGQADD